MRRRNAAGASNSKKLPLNCRQLLCISEKQTALAELIYLMQVT